MQDDPAETHNLWNLPEAAGLQMSMLTRMVERMAETVDPLPVRLSNW